MKEVRFQTKPKQENPTKGLVTELAPPHVQSAWGSKGERIQAAGLTTCCNNFSKKKKKKEREKDNPNQNIISTACSSVMHL